MASQQHTLHVSATVGDPVLHVICPGACVECDVTASVTRYVYVTIHDSDFCEHGRVHLV